MAKKRGKPTKNIFLRIVVFSFVVYAVVVLVDMQMNVVARNEELEVALEKREEQRLANKELERQLSDGSDEDYIERVAREKLDFVSPDERVFIDISGN